MQVNQSKSTLGLHCVIGASLIIPVRNWLLNEIIAVKPESVTDQFIMPALIVLPCDTKKEHTF